VVQAHNKILICYPRSIGYPEGELEGAITRYDGMNWQTFTTADGLKSEIIVSIAGDGEGNVWFGTFFDGIMHYNGSIWDTFDLPPKNSYTMAYSLRV